MRNFVYWDGRYQKKGAKRHDFAPRQWRHKPWDNIKDKLENPFYFTKEDQTHKR